MSDNGPQYSSIEFSKFAKAYQFVHSTSSPKFPQSNGEAEQTVQGLLKKADDRTTPVTCGYSPAELLMNRKLCSSVPISPVQLQPSVPDYSQLRENDEKKMKQKIKFDVRHRTLSVQGILCGLQIRTVVQLPGGNTIRNYSQKS